MMQEIKEPTPIFFGVTLYEQIEPENEAPRIPGAVYIVPHNKVPHEKEVHQH